jgi:L-gulonolactone oxidase
MNKQNILCAMLLLNTLLLHAGEPWKNRAGNQQCEPRSICYPESRDELIDCVQKSAAQGLKIRAVGAGYSRSSLACTDGCRIDLRNLNHVLSVDQDTMQVCVQAGTTITRLNESLASFGLALPNQAAVSEINLAGALSTASHGSGHTGSLSSFIVELELIDALGNVRTLSRNSDPDLFAAARVGLGALGIIYSVTLQCEQLFYLRSTHTTMKLEDFIAEYKSLHTAHDHFQAIWSVNSDEVKVDTWTRVDPTASGFDVEVCYKSLCWFSTANGAGKDIAAEFAVPIDALPAVLEHTKQLIHKYQNQGLTEMSTLVVRFSDGDSDMLLSPAGHGPVAYINVSTPIYDAYMTYYRELEEMMLGFKGRPHWGKINFLNHQKLLDPSGLFSNAGIDALFAQ